MKRKNNHDPKVLTSRLIYALSGNRNRSMQELATEFGVDKRTVLNHFGKIRKSKKFVIQKKGTNYRLTPLPGIRNSDFAWTPADIEKLYGTLLFGTIDDSLSTKLVYLVEAYLDSQKPSKVGKAHSGDLRDYFREITLINKAIREKKKINILKYKGRDDVHNGSKKGKDYHGVIPVHLDEQSKKLYCLLDTEPRCFNLERMGKVQATKVPYMSRPNWNPAHMTDVFGFLPKSSLKMRPLKVVLRMTNFAYSLLIRQFPAIDNSRNIVKLSKRSIRPYVLRVETHDPYALARFFAGIASEVEIGKYKTDETDEEAKALLKKWFDEYVKDGLQRAEFI